MAISLGNIFVQGVLGAAGGAAAGAAKMDEMKMKEEMELTKQERLSKLRTQEHATNKQFDLDAQEDERKRQSKFYADADAATNQPGKTITGQAMATFETDAGPDSVTSNTEATKIAPTRREKEEYYLDRARQAGDTGLIDRHTKGLSEARKDEDEQRKAQLDVDRNKIAAIRAESDRLKAEASQSQAEAANKRAEAMLKRIETNGNKGDEKDTARMKDIKFYAETVFGGGAGASDEQKQQALKDAAVYLINKEDKSTTDRVMKLAEDLSKDPAWMTKSTEERLTEARRLASTLEPMNDRKRGGVSAKPQGGMPTVPLAMPKPWERQWGAK